MRIVDLKRRGEDFTPTACGLCLGHFDGVHAGHRALIRALCDRNAARDVPLPLGALLFTESPASLLSGSPVPQLTTTEEKLDLLAACGLRFAVLCDFAEVRDLSPEAFVTEILIGRCHAELAVCGFNYTFGAKRAGNAETLVRLFGAAPERAAFVVPEVKDGIHTVSSSLIRECLANGHPEEAARMLCRPYALIATVTEGRHVGRELSAPTANLLFPAGKLVPALGVYAVRARIVKRTYRGVCNVGTRPTFDDGDTVNCEVFLLDGFHGDLYGKTVSVSFLSYIRAERTFASPAALAAQIREDVESAKRLLS